MLHIYSIYSIIGIISCFGPSRAANLFYPEYTMSQRIQLGGFIIENKTTNVVVDESLDSNLEAQKDWFYKTSGLMIK